MYGLARGDQRDKVRKADIARERMKEAIMEGPIPKGD